MSEESRKTNSIEDTLTKEEDVIEKDIEELNIKRDQLKRIRSLEDRRDAIQDDIGNIKERKKKIIFDNATFGNIILFIVLVFVAAGIVAEGGRILGKYAVLLLIPIAIILWKLANKFG